MNPRLAVNTAWMLLASRILLAIAACTSTAVLLFGGAEDALGRSLSDALPPMSGSVAIGIALLATAGLLGARVGRQHMALRVLPLAIAMVVLAMAVSGRAGPLRSAPATALALGLLAAGLILGRTPWLLHGRGLLAAGGLVGVISTAMFLGTAGATGTTVAWRVPIDTAPLLTLVAAGLLLSGRARRSASDGRDAEQVTLEIRRAWPTLAVVVATLLLGFGVTGLVVAQTERTLRSTAELRFRQLTERLTSESEQRVTRMAQGLDGARGMYAALPSVSGRQFSAYAAAQALPSEQPRSTATFFVARLPRQDLPAFVADARADEGPVFEVHPWAGAGTSSDSPYLYIVRHVFPPEGNRRLWGMEVGADPVRRASLERATRTGRPTITPSVRLTREGQSRVGIGYLVPVYRAGAALDTVADREAALLGLLGASVALDEVMAGAAEVVDGALDFEVYDGEDGAENAEIFVHHETEAARGLSDPLRSSRRRFETRTPIAMGGRTWTFAMRSSSKFENANDRTTPAIIGVCGGLLTLLVATVLWSLRMSRERALALAEEMTSDLCTSEETARLAAQKAERLAEVVRRTRDGVFITNATADIEWVNEAFTRMTGYTLDEAAGKRPCHLLRAPDSDTVEIRDAIRRKEAVTAEVVQVSKGGAEHVVAVEVVPLTDAAGTVTSFMWVQSDITERVRVTAELDQARSKAEAASRAKSEFLANMSHEIRTPLTAILGFADLLGDDVACSAEQRAQAVDTIRNAGGHLLAVINDILDLSKIEAEKMTVERVDTSLVELLHEVERLMRPRATGKGLALSIVLATPVPARIVGDPTRLRQILLNLLGNAVKFTELGAVTLTVNVASHEQRPRLVVDIDDTGPGLTPEEGARLFNPFAQADGTVTRKHGGTGLGLTICRRLAGLMGGDVSLVRSSPGHGSRFRLELPLEAVAGAPMVERLDAVAVRGEAGAARTSATAWKLDGRVLLAEDGPDNQRLLSFLLRKAGATVDIADNGVIALQMIDAAAQRGERYDLLLTDMQMPEMDGYSLARALRERGSDLAIVALTAHAMADDRDRCLAAGCDDYAAKPINRTAFLDTCTAWLGRPGGRRATSTAA